MRRHFFLDLQGLESAGVVAWPAHGRLDGRAARHDRLGVALRGEERATQCSFSLLDEIIESDQLRAERFNLCFKINQPSLNFSLRLARLSERALQRGNGSIFGHE